MEWIQTNSGQWKSFITIEGTTILELTVWQSIAGSYRAEIWGVHNYIIEERFETAQEAIAALEKEFVKRIGKILSEMVYIPEKEKPQEENPHSYFSSGGNVLYNPMSLGDYTFIAGTQRKPVGSYLSSGDNRLSLWYKDEAINSDTSNG